MGTVRNNETVGSQNIMKKTSRSRHYLSVAKMSDRAADSQSDEIDHETIVEIVACLITPPMECIRKNRVHGAGFGHLTK